MSETARPEPRTPVKWRPSLSLIVFLVLLSVLLLPLFTLYFLRVYQNQLIQQTESDLIAQSAALAAVFHREVEASIAPEVTLGTKLPPAEPTDAPPPAPIGSNGDAAGQPAPGSVPYGSARQADRVVIGSTFYERREIRDILAFLRLLVDPDDEASLRRIINVPKRGIGPKSVARLSVWATQHDVSLRVALGREPGARPDEELLGDLAHRPPLHEPQHHPAGIAPQQPVAGQRLRVGVVGPGGHLVQPLRLAAGPGVQVGAGQSAPPDLVLEPQHPLGVPLGQTDQPVARPFFRR